MNRDLPMLIFRIAGAIFFIAAGLSKETMLFAIAYICLLASWWCLYTEKEENDP